MNTEDVKKVYGTDEEMPPLYLKDMRYMVGFALNTILSPRRERYIRFLQVLSNHKGIDSVYQLTLKEIADFLENPIDAMEVPNF